MLVEDDSVLLVWGAMFLGDSFWQGQAVVALRWGF